MKIRRQENNKMKYFFSTLLELPLWTSLAREQARYIFERMESNEPNSKQIFFSPKHPYWTKTEQVEADLKEQGFDSLDAETMGIVTLLLSDALENGSVTLSISQIQKALAGEDSTSIKERVKNYFSNRKRKDLSLLTFLDASYVKDHLNLISQKISDPEYLKELSELSNNTDFEVVLEYQKSSVLDMRSPYEDPKKENISFKEIDPYPDTPSDALNVEELKKPIVFSIGNFYFARYYASEVKIANILNHRLSSQNPFFDRSDDSKNKLLTILKGLFPKENLDKDIKYDWQKVAVAMSFLHSFSVITGGPGTGKTTTVAKLLVATALLRKALGNATNLTIGLAAPTGKAAARMKESLKNSFSDPNVKLGEFIKITLSELGLSPEYSPEQLILESDTVTLHSLLGMYPGSLKAVNNHQNTLKYDIIVVDEVSMVDLMMMRNLLDALDEDTAIVLLGDHDQLSSVSAGTVLGDICSDLKKGGTNIPSEDQKLLHELTKTDLAEGVMANGIVKLLYSRRFNEKSAIGKLASIVNSDSADKEELDQFFKNDQGINVTNNYANFKEGVYLGIPKIDSKDTDDKKKGIDDSDMLDLLRKNTFIKYVPRRNSSNDDESSLSFKNYFDSILAIPEVCLSVAEQSATPNDEHISEGLKEVFDNILKFRVLSPVHDGDLGERKLNFEYNKNSCDYVNQSINEQINSKEVSIYDSDWFPGKVFLITKNNYNWDLHNGDTVIAGWDPKYPNSKRIWVKRESKQDNGQEVSSFESLPFNMIPDLSLGYVLTVHKSQGSEFDHTVIVLPETSGNSTKELFYTAITRAKTKLSIYAKVETIKEAISRTTDRMSGLCSRLISY